MSATLSPSRGSGSLQQRREALVIANRVRSDGAAVKRELASGGLSVSEALDDPRAQALEVRVLLTAQMGWGPARAGRVLRRNLIAERRRVDALTGRQRELLRAELSS